MTSVKSFKNAHKIIDGELKVKKDLPANNVQSDKETLPNEKNEKKLDISKMNRDELISQISIRQMEIELMKVQLNKLNQESEDVKIA